MKYVVVALADLGETLAFAPERYIAAGLRGSAGVPLSTLVKERTVRVAPRDLGRALVVDTTHARDGVLDVRSALRAATVARSGKKRFFVGDLLVSRLRPYLRQIALAHPVALAECEAQVLACSTEFHVLSPVRPGDSLAYLLPYLLAEDAQAVLAAGQEGGHHPRVPFETILALRVPRAVVRAHRAASARVEAALGALHAAGRQYGRALEPRS